ncbi:CehA/McbA family metallohydrolase [Celeribacter litoreus]|uniref:CehA/McbA family metallohydrolase n=1 Tax=Celeribacter litoreus TaxID=2876714 RepID=UPI001CCE6959|nr:CehA/McbA family metallohydrolase [Celeribacter litoreus]MCA0043317.1 CehA/McbA family metallohydrolase [Celeribacter litoreus]
MPQTFTGHLGLDHMGTHVPHAFTVPEGVGTLRIRFTHDPAHPGSGDIPHQLSISVYGPNGARGTRHNNADQSPVISTHHASPGYLPGPIEAGDWRVEIDVHRILPPGGVSYRIEVDWDADELPAPDAPPVQTATRNRGEGWYKGDLHGHTLHSDGALTVAEYLDYALERGFDFVALTDHNTTSALPELMARAGEAITILPGEELTTYNGHALVLGTTAWVDWAIRDGQTMAGRAREVTEDGKVFVIAHPKSEGHPFCTGCRWAFADLLPGPARHVEVWNGPWTSCPQNPGGVALFYRWLNEGYRMIATCGTDTHRRAKPDQRHGFNVIRAADNTLPALLDGLRAGESYITSGPLLYAQAISAGESATFGDCLPAGEVTATCVLGDEDMPGDLTLTLIHNGKVIARTPCATGLEHSAVLTAGSGDWITWELRDSDGALHTITNAILFGGEEAWI